VKILVVSNLFPPDVLGGYEILCAQVCRALRARGHEVRVLTSAPPRRDAGVGHEPERGKEHARREISRVGRRRRMGDALALEIGERLVGAVGAHDRGDVVAHDALVGAQRDDRHRAGQVDTEADAAGAEIRNMQAPGAHGLNQRRRRIRREIHHLLARRLGERVHQGLEGLLIHLRRLHRRIGEYDCRRILQPGRIRRHVGNQIAVGVAIKRVELSAVRACVLRRSGRRKSSRQQQNGAGDGKAQIDRRLHARLALHRG
jgi:hypothetical protein